MTGSASGIGHATTQLLRERGNIVIGVDLRDADITTDLTTVGGRLEFVRPATDLSHGGMDAVLAIAGVSALAPVTVAMNYFGTVATLQGLRPLLARCATRARWPSRLWSDVPECHLRPGRRQAND